MAEQVKRGARARVTEGLREAILRQHDFLRDREPAYARLLEILAHELPVLAPSLDRIWEGRCFYAFYEQPLLLLGSLRYAALAEGPGHPLWTSIGAPNGAARRPTPDELRAAIAPDRVDFWTAVAERSVQTNDTTRAVAWLWPAGLISGVDAVTPLHVVDVGTSAGLNLVADDPDLAVPWTDELGASLGAGPLPPIATRLGLDLSPLDVLDEDSARWLRACVWPFDVGRLDRLEQAISAFERATRSEAPPRLEKCPIEDVPARAAQVGAGERLLVLQTIMRDYLSPQQQETYDREITELIGSRSPGTAMWIELEVDHDTTDPEQSAVLRAHVAGPSGGVDTVILARTHPHPRTLFLEPAGVDRLRRVLGPPRGRE